MDKNTKYTSPFGKAIYPHLNKPDTHFAKGDMSKAKYHVKLEFDEKDAKGMISQYEKTLKVALEEEKQKSKGKSKGEISQYKPYVKENDKVIFNFKMNAQGTNHKTNEVFTQKPALFDNEGKPLNSDLTIWGGSNLRVSYTTHGWFAKMMGGAGVTFRLKSVQVKDLVTGTSANSESHGFAKVDGNSSTKNDTTENLDEVAETSADF